MIVYQLTIRNKVSYQVDLPDLSLKLNWRTTYDGTECFRKENRLS